MHARAFRRLEDKTQVFTAGISDHFRNRLTHTFEVAQVARTVARVLGLDEDLTEVLALAHDIGHPPFAHSGEEELDRQMQRFGDRFNHNLHSLRIVESFEHRYARFPGLNLTFEVREGMAKHSRDFEPGEAPELEEYLPGLRPPLEAQIIDLADEIAYNTADLDDGVSAGFFTAEQIAAEVPQYGSLVETAETQFAGAPDRVRFLESLRMCIDVLVSGLIEGTAAEAVRLGLGSLEAVRQAPRAVRLTADAEELNTGLKKFLTRRLYHSDVLVAEREVSSRRVAALFSHFLENPGDLPEGYADPCRPAHRAVCDYIAGMTDGYFTRLYTTLVR